MTTTRTPQTKRTEATRARRLDVRERRRRDGRRYYWTHHEKAKQIRRDSGARVRANRREIELSRMHPLIATILRHLDGELGPHDG